MARLNERRYDVVKEASKTSNKLSNRRRPESSQAPDNVDENRKSEDYKEPRNRKTMPSGSPLSSDSFSDEFFCPTKKMRRRVLVQRTVNPLLQRLSDQGSDQDVAPKKKQRDIKSRYSVQDSESKKISSVRYQQSIVSGDEVEEDETEGLSDFIVSDSSASHFSEERVRNSRSTRPRRRLVRGRRQKSESIEARSDLSNMDTPAAPERESSEKITFPIQPYSAANVSEHLYPPRESSCASEAHNQSQLYDQRPDTHSRRKQTKSAKEVKSSVRGQIPTQQIDPEISRLLTQRPSESQYISSDDEAHDSLILQPPRPRTPIKQTELPRAETPPASPTRGRIRLASPKKPPRIPSTPHRSSVDAFWSQDAINDWNDEYSPKKDLTKSFFQTDATPAHMSKISPVKSTSKKDPIATSLRKDFESRKHVIAENFLEELDATITTGQISQLTSATGGVKLVWNKKLSTTAGRANWKREKLIMKRATATTSSASMPPLPASEATHRHHASIELAEKVIDNEHRLLNVVAHEFCHLANFMVSGETGNPHGRAFKGWAARCSAAFGHRGIEVTTKHSYEIDYKYAWACAGCGAEYKRHSRSIDVAKHRCGRCKGLLAQTMPAPRANAGPTEYQSFLKDNMKRIRAQNPGSPQKKIMEMVAERYREHKAAKSDPAPAFVVPAGLQGLSTDDYEPAKSSADSVADDLALLSLGGGL